MIQGPSGNMNRVKYFIENWKIGIHLLLRTKRFGVNNQWWSDWDSLWGNSFGKILWDIVSVKGILRNYRGMKFRAEHCHFMSDEEKVMIGWESKH